MMVAPGIPRYQKQKKDPHLRHLVPIGLDVAQPAEEKPFPGDVKNN